METETKQLAPSIENVLPFYLQKAALGQSVCLVTLFHVDDVSPRPIGSQIAVSEDGESFGFITGGCAEKAIVHEALIALREKKSTEIRIGSESPWFDIKLPCGGGIEIYFSVADSTEVISQACESLLRRTPVSLGFDLVNDRVFIVGGQGSKLRSTDRLFVRQYVPTTQLVIVGAGPYVGSLSRLAEQADIQPIVWSPETPPEFVVSKSTGTYQLNRSQLLQGQGFDSWMAIVLLFHEHDWEPKLLKAALESACFYIGALGSRKTHANRLESLRQLGCSDEQLRRIHGPVGLPISARTPNEIAISILAELIQVKNRRFNNG